MLGSSETIFGIDHVQGILSGNRFHLSNVFTLKTNLTNARGNLEDNISGEKNVFEVNEDTGATELTSKSCLMNFCWTSSREEDKDQINTQPAKNTALRITKTNSKLVHLSFTSCVGRMARTTGISDDYYYYYGTKLK
ncbi:unnamed protein product [Allacma fusca]|uniref:Uncharacterized protein n=1 Tax=Allacma fusca TaxID=39272 RepID=A0A8J2NVF0_9HEXA|nr:unnamed protein product [Allacma fusca]